MARLGIQVDVFGKPYFLRKQHLVPASVQLLGLKHHRELSIPLLVLPKERSSITEGQADAQLELCLNEMLACVGPEKILLRILDAVRHVEAVCFYVNDLPCFEMERFSTLSPRREGSLLKRMLDVAPEGWSPSEKRLVTIFYLLFESGRSIRFEEFNGTTVSARDVEQAILRIASSYGLSTATDRYRRGEMNLLNLSSEVGARSKCVDPPGTLRTRWNSGLTFRKTEFVLHLSGKDDDESVAVDPATCAILSSIGLDLPRCFLQVSDVKDWCQKLFRQAIDKGECAPAGKILSEFIGAMVQAAVFATNSDYGMSSSIRRLFRVHRRAAADIAQQIVNLQPADFFCCLRYSTQIRERFGDSLETSLCRMVQARMRFNRWHFIAGNLPPERVPPKRHYYFPPCMPDRTEWSDGFHGGHIGAQVRHCIRSPGPDMSEAALEIGGLAFRGFYDVRVVRTDGNAYTVAEMLQTRQYCKMVGAVFRTWTKFADYLPELEIDDFRTGTEIVAAATRRLV